MRKKSWWIEWTTMMMLMEISELRVLVCQWDSNAASDNLKSANVNKFNFYFIFAKTPRAFIFISGPKVFFLGAQWFRLHSMLERAAATAVRLKLTIICFRMLARGILETMTWSFLFVQLVIIIIVNGELSFQDFYFHWKLSNSLSCHYECPSYTL